MKLTARELLLLLIDACMAFEQRIQELCQEHGISDAQRKKWQKEYHEYRYWNAFAWTHFGMSEYPFFQKRGEEEAKQYEKKLIITEQFCRALQKQSHEPEYQLDDEDLRFFEIHRLPTISSKEQL